MRGAYTLIDHGPLTAEQLTAQLGSQGRTATRTTIDRALAELAAAGAAVIDAHTGRWMFRPATRHPLLEAVDLHGAPTFAPLLDLGMPAFRAGTGSGRSVVPGGAKGTPLGPCS